jgi:hypothetical protein
MLAIPRSDHRQEGPIVTRICVILGCSLICLLVLTGPAFAQGTAPEVLGTPPPEGHTILEVATVAQFRGLNQWLTPSVPVTRTIDLPLPEFASGPALSSQCLWSVSYVGCDVEVEEEPASYIDLDISYTLEGATLTVELLNPDPYSPPAAHWFFYFYVSGVAIRTEPASPVESTSFGEIKAMFRDE